MAWHPDYLICYPDKAKVINIPVNRVQNTFQNRFEKLHMARNVSVGIDWGTISWVVVRANGFPPDPKKSKVIYIERIDSKTLVEKGFEGFQTDHVRRAQQIIDFFNAKMIINDANGLGVDRNAFLIRKYPTRCYGCFYDTDETDKQRKKVKLLIPTFSESNRRVTVSRLTSFKNLVQEYEARQVSIPRLDPIVEQFIKHHSNLVFERYEDEKTSVEYEVVGKKGPDHLAHADNYSKIGFDKLTNVYGMKNQAIGVITKSSVKAVYDNVHPLLK